MKPDRHPSLRRQHVLLVTRRGLSGGDPAYHHLSAGLDYARIHFSVLDLGASPSLTNLDRFSSVALATHEIQDLDDLSVRRLSDFVAAGGGLIVAVPVWNHELAPLLGVDRSLGRRVAPPEALTTTVEFVTDFFPGLEGLKASLPFTESNFAHRLRRDDAVEPLAFDGEGEPVAWVHRFGRGKVVVWNTQLLVSRFGIGLLVQSVLHSQRVALAPVANAGIVQIDDFPAAFSNLAAEPLLSEFGLKFVDFLHQVWMPDMLRLGEEFDVTYTFFVMFAYNDAVVPPFSFGEWEQYPHETGDGRIPLPAAMGREVGRRHELGLHGYNHLPPTRAVWKEERHLAAAIRAALARWEQDGLGELPRCFVPAMNEIDPCGLRALASAAPGITTISGHYLGDFRLGQAREFGQEPWSSHFFSLPRWTDGYEMHPMNQLFLLSSLAAFGVWSHFLHPDDVIDTTRNYPDRDTVRNAADRMWRSESAGTRSIRSQLRSWLRFNRQHFPWLRYLGTSDARTVIEEHLRSRPEVYFDDDRVSIHSTGPLRFQLRLSEPDLEVVSDDGSIEVVGCHRGAGYALYAMTKAEGTAELRLRRVALGAGVPTKPHLVEPPAHRRSRGSVSAAEDEEAPRDLCFVADTQGWAFDNIARSVSAHLPPRFRVEIRYRDAYKSEADLHRDLFLGPGRQDFVHFFWHPTLAFLFDPNVSIDVLGTLDEETRASFISRVARTCKTTSVYSHQFLTEHEPDRIQLAGLALADGYAVASSRLMRHHGARDFLPPPSAVLADGVDLDLFRPIRSDRLLDTDRTIRVGWAGNSTWGSGTDHKGLETIIKPLLARLAGEGLDVRGDFCDRNVAWTPRELMPSYYNRIDVYVCASLNEGTPNPVLEAMACGLPILSTDVGIVREVFGPLQREFIVADRSSPEFAGKLRRLVTEPALRMELARENQRSVRACSWERRTEQWIRFFSEVEARKREDGSAPRQIAALYRAFDAGRQLRTIRGWWSPPAASASSVRGPAEFLLKKAKAWRAGKLPGKAFRRHLRDTLRVLALSFRGDRSVREWCERRELPRCFPFFNWWRYVSDHPDLVRAGIESPHGAARHWLEFGRHEHRTLWPLGAAAIVRQLRAIAGRPFRTHGGDDPRISVVAAATPDDARRREQLESVRLQTGVSLELLRIRPGSGVEHFAPRRSGNALATPLTLRPADADSAEELNRAVLQARGNWIVPLADGECFARPDSLRTALEAADADTELLVWAHGSSHGSTSIRSAMDLVQRGDVEIAGHALRADFRRLLVDDGYAGARTRLLRMLADSLRTQWIDDVLTYRPCGPDARSTVPANPSDGRDLEPGPPVDLVLAFWSDARTFEIQKRAFHRERVYSFLAVEDRAANENLPRVLEVQEGRRVLLLGPDARLAPYFSRRWSREVAKRVRGAVDLCFLSGSGGRTAPLAILTDGASLRRITSPETVLSFDALCEELRAQGRSFTPVDEELFQPIDA